MPTGRPWTWTTLLVGRLCPGSGRHVHWHRSVPLVSLGWAQWKEGSGSTSCFQRETPSPCPSLPPQSWASGSDVERHTHWRTCSHFPLQMECVPARGRWMKSPEISLQSSRPSWSLPKHPKPWGAPCLRRPREGEKQKDKRKRWDARERREGWQMGKNIQ